MKEISDTTMSVSTPAHISAKPPIGSYAYTWLSPSGSQFAFELTAPTGSIIDVHATYMLQDDQAAGTSYTVAAGTLGALYYLPLDGATDLYLPVGLGTTT
jgi:hypothetical protein